MAKLVQAQVSCLILAGGKSKRMGADKCFLKLGNKSMVEHALSLLKPYSSQFILVNNTPQKIRTLNLEFPLIHVPDLMEGAGPLGGIASGIQYASCPYVLVRAVDMPYLEPGLIDALFYYAADYDCVIPQTAGGCEPLSALYQVESIKSSSLSLIEEGKRRVSALQEGKRVYYLSPEELREWGVSERSFENLNFPQQFHEVQHEFLRSSRSAAELCERK